MKKLLKIKKTIKKNNNVNLKIKHQKLNHEHRLSVVDFKYTLFVTKPHSVLRKHLNYDAKSL